MCLRSPLMALGVSSQLNINGVAIGGEADVPPAPDQLNATDPKAGTGSPVSIEAVCGLCGCAARQTHREHRTIARLAGHGHRHGA
jgi:hypothetical protein